MKWSLELRQALCNFYSEFDDCETRLKLLEVFIKSEGNIYGIVLGVLAVLGAKERARLLQSINACSASKSGRSKE
jgi:hypothetical protein